MAYIIITQWASLCGMNLSMSHASLCVCVCIIWFVEKRNVFSACRSIYSHLKYHTVGEWKPEKFRACEQYMCMGRRAVQLWRRVSAAIITANKVLFYSVDGVCSGNSWVPCGCYVVLLLFASQVAERRCIANAVCVCSAAFIDAAAAVVRTEHIKVVINCESEECNFLVARRTFEH